MDYASMIAGAKLMLPVNEPGAFLFLGDGHARQGEGEVAGTGLETSLDVEFTVDLLKKKNIGWPRLENNTHIMVLGSARPLLEAFQIATAEMQRWLVTDYGMTERGAQTFLGQAAEYEIANVVDPSFTVVGKIRKTLLPRRSAAISPSALRAAAAYLDNRLDWWVHWPNAARDHDTSCVSCHTALPYALARPAIHRVLDEPEPAAPERIMLANVTKRVRLWKEVEPFYPDQTRGLPKTSESRGTESVLNALVLATRDASRSILSDDAREAFNNMWALQFKAGELKGAWAWLNFHYAPWESDGSAYFGASIAAIAVGTAPGNYAATPDIQEQIKLLRDYLQQRADTEYLFNRAMVLWASSKLSGLLTPAQRKAIIDAAVAKQHEDGGWSIADLGPWKRVDSTPLDTSSDGYATGLMTLALQSAGVEPADTHVSRALSWLSQHQDPATGMWSASSLNKQRDPATEIGKFMNDAATAYAILALVEN